MEFGMTIPLQRRYKIKQPPYGRGCDSFFCWDIHVITLSGGEYLLAVNCSCRFAVVLSAAGVSGADLAEIVQNGICRALLAEGIPKATVEAYLELTGLPVLTKTHGRREVAFLNRAWEDAAALEYLTDDGQLDQLLLDEELNGLARRCAGHEGKGSAAELLAVDLRDRDFPPTVTEAAEAGQPPSG